LSFLKARSKILIKGGFMYAMPMGKGTYGSKRGRPSKKNTVKPIKRKSTLINKKKKKK